jgi:cytochrome P450
LTEGTSGPDDLESASPFDVPASVRELQKSCPVSRFVTPAGDGAWVATGYREVRQLFSHPALGRTHPNPEDAPRIYRSSVLDMMLQGYETEPEDHELMRQQLAPYFSQAAARAFRPGFRRLVSSVLDEMQQRGSPADIHRDLSLPVAVGAIAEMMGLSSELSAQLYPICEGIFEPGNAESEQASVGSAIELLKPVVVDRRAGSGSDMISRLSRETYADQPPESVAVLVGGLFFAGYTNTVRVMDLGVMFLATNPAARQKLSNDPSLIVQAREEVLRKSRTSGGSHPRYARADIEVGGVTIEAGELVVLDLGAANHDERVFPRPELFDVTRTSNPHLSFGAGHWFCIGAPVARLELEIVFAEVLKRFPGMRPAVPVDRLPALVNPMTGALSSLPVEW